MDLIDRNGIDRLGRLRLDCERGQKTENSKGEDCSSHLQISPENRQPVL
jgi:hypothetical protein